MAGEEIKAVAESGGTRLDVFVAEKAECTRSHAKNLIEEGNVTVNGIKAAKSGALLKAGDVVVIVNPSPKEHDLSPQDIPIEIVWQDEDFAVSDVPCARSGNDPFHGFFNKLVIYADGETHFFVKIHFHFRTAIRGNIPFLLTAAQCVRDGNFEDFRSRMEKIRDEVENEKPLLGWLSDLGTYMMLGGFVAMLLLQS